MVRCLLRTLRIDFRLFSPASFDVLVLLNVVKLQYSVSRMGRDTGSVQDGYGVEEIH